SQHGREIFWIRNTSSFFPEPRATPASTWDSPAINERLESPCNARSRRSKKGFMKDYITRLRDAIKIQHGCASTHIQTIPLTEQSERKRVWQGEVEMVELHGHPQARLCYTWGYLGDDDTEQYAAVLEL